MAKVRSAYWRERVTFSSKGPSRTKQAHKAECDINTIMAKYARTGLINHVAKYKGAYEDLPDGNDFQEALHIQMQANEAFMSLPSKIRSEFENDPGQFLAFVSDPANKDRMREMGLLREVEPRVVDPAPIVHVATAPVPPAK